jgi:hypothetical protein
MRRRILISAGLTAMVVMWFAGVAMAQDDTAGDVTKIKYFDWFIIKGG